MTAPTPEIYSAPHLKRSHYTVSLAEQEEIISRLPERGDAESKRLQRYLALPDLTRTPGNPVHAVTERVINLPTLRNLDLIETPEVISPKVVFDLFNFPADHPARSRSDTYYVDQEHILRPHTSLMWKYYLEIPEVQQQLAEHGSAGALCYGTVYRRDEIDWQHTNVLHHIDGLFISKRSVKEMEQPDLEAILWEVARALFGSNVVGRFNVEHYPYTDPSLEMEIAWDDTWVEILGAGIVHTAVIKNLGLDPAVYCGWAFGFGADRLAMLKMRIPDIRLLRSTDERVLKQFQNIDQVFVPVSKYPPIQRDISFIVNKDVFNLNAYYETIREVVGEDLIEEAKLIDHYEDEAKFGRDKASYTFRIIYRHLDRTLTNAEIDVLHQKLETETVRRFEATIRSKKSG
jgi:phenylalanyl-tRNA synthetase alpha chain